MGYTTNLALPYPADTDFVGDGYLAIQNLADTIDGYFGASTSYTPTTTNVTGGTKAGQYNLVGHWLDFWVQISGTATATAAGSITISLPAGLIASSAGYVQPVNAMRGSNVSAAYVLSSPIRSPCSLMPQVRTSRSASPSSPCACRVALR